MRWFSMSLTSWYRIRILGIVESNGMARWKDPPPVSSCWMVATYERQFRFRIPTTRPVGWVDTIPRTDTLCSLSSIHSYVRNVGLNEQNINIHSDSYRHCFHQKRCHWTEWPNCFRITVLPPLHRHVLIRDKTKKVVESLCMADSFFICSSLTSTIPVFVSNDKNILAIPYMDWCLMSSAFRPASDRSW
jgi:hypothetical protein